MTRPEGLLMAVTLWLIVALRWWRGEDRPGRLTVLLAPTAALALSLIPTALNYALTGDALATGVQAKSWFENVPFRPVDILTSVGRDFLTILQRLSLGFLADPPWPLIPLLLPLAVLGLAVLGLRRQYAVVGLVTGWFLLGTLSTATLITAIWHRGRYQIPMVALLLPIAVVGAIFLLERLPQRAGRIVAATSVPLLIGLSIWQTGQAVNSYAHSVYSTASQQIAIAEWIRVNLPPQARVGVHDAGAIRYVGRRPTFDMIGLTSQGVASAWRNGIGAVFERMENAADRPDYFATYPDVFSLPYLQATDLFAEERFRVNVPDFSSHSAAGPTQAVYAANWRYANSGREMAQADLRHTTASMALVDTIDVADLDDERRHNLIWWEGPVLPGFSTEVRQYHYRTEPEHTVLDGGRLLTGGMTFEVAVRQRTDLLLVGRFHAQDSVTVDVSVNGHDVGQWRYPALPGEWLESGFEIPAEYVTVDPLPIELVLSAENAPGVHFEPYYLWFWQGDRNDVAAAPLQQTHVRFAGSLELLGYDLGSTQIGPGDNVPLVLYWRSTDKTDVDAVVFVHLYDRSGELVAQLDQRPYHGVRPPYTWRPDEIVIDPKFLALPPDLANGQYLLTLGLYDPVTLTRLEIDESGQTVLSGERLLLQTLVVSGE